MPAYPSTLNRQTVISFPLNNQRTNITTGIQSGSLYLNKLLFQKQLNFGECNSDRFEVTLFGCDDISNETIQVYQVDNTDPNNPVTTNLFYGVVDSCLKEDNEVNRRLVAYDLMYTKGNEDATDWWNTYWEDKISSTIEDLLTDLLSTFSVTLSSASTTLLSNIDTADLSITQFSGFSAITFGTVLSYIGQVLMCNPHFNNEGELDLVVLGANFTGDTVSLVDTNNEAMYEDANSHFEDYNTPPVDRVVIYGETDVIAGEYGSGDNVYVIKNNPLLYNLTDTTYNDLAQTIYENLYNAQSSTGYTGTCYVPANIKMIVSKTDLQLGDIVTTTHGNSVVSSLELSGIMLVEQTITSSGNQSLTPDDFNATTSTAGRALEQATTTSRHFVWVPNSGAYVTTDNTPAGQAPTTNYTKLTEQGLYVATGGKEVAHFGIDDNNAPVSVLGSTDAGGTYVEMSDAGILAGKQLSDAVKSDYFSIIVPGDSELFFDKGSILYVENNRGYLDITYQGYTYLGISKVRWLLSASPFNMLGMFVTELSHAKKGFDIFIDRMFYEIFRNISDTTLTDNSSLHDWFVAYDTPADAVSISVLLDINWPLSQIIIDFLDQNNENTAFANASHLRLYVPNDFEWHLTNPNAGVYLSTDEYSYDPTNPNEVEILDYAYYNDTARPIYSSLNGTTYTLYIDATTIRFIASMIVGEVNYTATIGNSVNTNNGKNAIVFGDDNIVTATSEQDVFVAGTENTVDSVQPTGAGVNGGSCILGNTNINKHNMSYLIGTHNRFRGNPARSTDCQFNYAFGFWNEIDPVTGSNLCDYNVAVGSMNRIEGRSVLCFGDTLEATNTNSNEAVIYVGKKNTAPKLSSPAIVFGSGNYDTDYIKHNIMELGDRVLICPASNYALVFDNNGEDKNLNFRYQNDAGGTGANFIRLVPTGTSNGAIMGMSAGGLTVVGGGESVAAIVNDPTTIGITTASEALVASADSSILFISNAGTIANYKRIAMGSDGLFQIDECSGTGINLAYFDSAGKLKRDNRSFYSKGDSFSGWTFAGLGGYLTSTQKEIVVFLPMPFTPSLISTSGLTIKITVRHTNGGYPYLYNATTQLNGATVVNNGTKISGLSSVSFDSRSVGGMALHLTFANALQRSASSTSTAITNNTPLGVAIEISGSFAT